MLYLGFENTSWRSKLQFSIMFCSQIYLYFLVFKNPGPGSVPLFSESGSATMEAHLFVAHHRDIIQAIKVGKRLEIGLVFNQLLSASVNTNDFAINSKIVGLAGMEK
jgi:hypothetical protein